MIFYEILFIELALKSVSTSRSNSSLSQPNAKLSKQKRPKSTAISGINVKELESNFTNVATNPTQTLTLSNNSDHDNALMNQNVKIRINTKQEAQAAIAERRRLIREESLKQKQVGEFIEPSPSPIKTDGSLQSNQVLIYLLTFFKLNHFLKLHSAIDLIF